MNKRTIIAALFTMALFFVNQQVFAQAEEQEIVIEKVTVAKDGKEVKETIKLSGEEAKAYMKKHHGSGDEIHIEVDGKGNVTVDEDIKIIKEIDGEYKMDGLHEGHEDGVMINITDKNGMVTLEIQKGDEDPFVWKGEGEIPATVKAEAKTKYGIDLDEKHGRDGTELEEVIEMEVKENQNKARLGVMIGEESGQSGAVVGEVLEGSVAEKAGIQKGDVITGINGKAIETAEQLVEAIGQYEVGDEIEIAYTRADQQKSAKVALEANDHKVIFWKSKDGEKIDLEGKDFQFHTEENVDGKKVIKKKIIVKEMEDGSEAPNENANVEFDNTLDLATFKAFPNPTEGKVTVTFEAKAVPTTVTITDISGKEIFKEALNNFDGQYNKTINLESATKGALLLNIQQGEKFVSKRLIYQ